MPATVTLPTTTLAIAVGTSDTRIQLASTSGLLPGMFLWVDGELMEFKGTDVDPWILVKRGTQGSRGHAHASGQTVYLAYAHQVYDHDPIGRPPAVIPVSPHINVVLNRVWFAQGDATPSASADRWWSQQAITHDQTSLGVRTTTPSPTSST